MSRSHNHEHNRINGTLGYIGGQLRRVADADSLTPRAHFYLMKAWAYVARAEEETWRHRKDLDGSITRVKHARERDFFNPKIPEDFDDNQ